MNVSNSNGVGLITPSRLARPSVAVAMRSINCVTKMMRRRSTISARAPEKSPKASVGAVLAVCTKATMKAEGVNVAISHAAIVACIV